MAVEEAGGGRFDAIPLDCERVRENGLRIQSRLDSWIEWLASWNRMKAKAGK